MEPVKSSNISNRHSIRRFTDKPVSDDDVEGILHAGMIAPSSKNRQPWKVYVVRDPLKGKMVESMTSEIRRKDEDKGPEVDPKDFDSADVSMHVISECPVVFVVCHVEGDPYKGVKEISGRRGLTDRELMDTLSIGAMVENMILEATERGLGSLWIGDFTYAYDQLRDVTGIRENVVAVVAVGHPASHVERNHRRDPDRIVFLRSSDDLPGQQDREVEHQKHPGDPLHQ